jgi:hypothetical protein
MNKLLWVLISVTIIVLFFNICMSCNISENMTVNEAVDTANEYAKNLQAEQDKLLKNAQTAKDEIATTQKLLDDTTKTLTAATNAKNKANIDKYSALKQVYTDKIAKLNKDVESYTKQADLLTIRIKAEQESADRLNKMKEATAQPVSEDATGVAFVADKDGKMVPLTPQGVLNGSPTYYEPGTYRFGASTYVPSYEESIYLSKTTGQSTVTTYLDEAAIKGGSCSYYKTQPEKIEEMCMAVDKNNCGAMSCCVLLGGSKCVGGTKLGPSNKLNYGDITVKEKDYYYHMGKCYGNCK